MVWITVDSFKGIIGVGKTTFCRQLQSLIPGSIVFEEVVCHEYLSDMYRDIQGGVKPSHAATCMQFRAMANRFGSSMRANEIVWATGRTVISDRCFVSDLGFAHKLALDGYIDEKDFETYSMHLRQMERQIMAPHIVVNLETSPDDCIKRIEGRIKKETGRDCECGISRQYLEELGESFCAVVRPWYLGRGSKIIDVNWKDGDNNLENIKGILWKIRSLAPTISCGG